MLASYLSDHLWNKNPTFDKSEEFTVYILSTDGKTIKLLVQDKKLIKLR